MRSEAQSVDAYLAELPADRREEVALMRQLVLDNLEYSVRQLVYSRAAE